MWAGKDTDTAGCSLLLPPVGSWVLQEALQPMIVPYDGHQQLPEGVVGLRVRGVQSQLGLRSGQAGPNHVPQGGVEGTGDRSSEAGIDVT